MPERYIKVNMSRLTNDGVAWDNNDEPHLICKLQGKHYNYPSILFSL